MWSSLVNFLFILYEKLVFPEDDIDTVVTEEIGERINTAVVVLPFMSKLPIAKLPYPTI